MLSRYQTLVLALLLVAMTAVILLAVHLNFVQDDAYISFRYASNLLDGQGLVYNAGERVEGFTNFLWVIILALSKGILGLDYLITARILSFGVIAVIYILLFLLLSRVKVQRKFLMLAGITVLMLANLSLPYWAVSGLETVFFGALVLIALYCEYARPNVTPAFLIVATLIRPEGALLFGIVFLNRLIGRRKIDWRFAAYYILPLIPFALFKWLYYGSLFPNPMFAKSGLGLEYIQSGLNYLWFFTRTLGVFGLIFVPPLLAVKRLWTRYSLLYLFVAIYILYIVLVGGDVLKVYRFFVPVVPVLYLLFVLSVKELLAWSGLRKFRSPAFSGTALLIVCVGTAAGSYLLSAHHINTYLKLERMLTDKMQFTAVMLRKHMGPDFSVAASTIGILGYELPGHRIIDMLGLTDRYISRHPETISGLQSTWQERHFNSRYILEQHPDFILFSTNDKPSAPAELALLLHSEFRRCYSPIAFPHDSSRTWALIYKRWKDVAMNKDLALDNFDFALKLKDGFENRNRQNYMTALISFQSAKDLLSSPYGYLDFNIGVCYYGLGKGDSARYYLQSALTDEPYNSQARRLLARIDEVYGDTLAARAQRREIQRYSPWIFDKGD
ncbi:membrane hypothetical protein [Candidatus Zixiibacteriota bacterium]|nr:membrane hypothetical protein [candidate division Zixibacteria bacterium]